ncbi:hypothetical protein BC826DRAFT_670292 [Russula brevipes]|nr:hypothetical protein BC826DRAFT_670292 [Russula brevipes]
MSSTTPSPSTATSGPPFAPPTSGPSQNPGGGGGGGPSSSLYLRRIEEAILAGVMPPPHTGRASRRRALGEKPKLWEARVYPAADDRWDTIVPVSVLPTITTATATAAVTSGEHANDATVNANVNRSRAAVQAPVSDAPPLALSDPPTRRLWPRNLFSRGRGRATAPSLAPTSEPEDSSGGGLLQMQGQNAPSPTSSSSPPPTYEQLQVTVLIAMPDPRRPHPDGMAFTGHLKGKERSLDMDYEEDDLPEMALGLTELQHVDTIATPLKSTS